MILYLLILYEYFPKFLFINFLSLSTPGLNLCIYPVKRITFFLLEYFIIFFASNKLSNNGFSTKIGFPRLINDFKFVRCSDVGVATIDQSNLISLMRSKFFMTLMLYFFIILTFLFKRRLSFISYFKIRPYI